MPTVELARRAANALVTPFRWSVGGVLVDLFCVVDRRDEAELAEGMVEPVDSRGEWL